MYLVPSDHKPLIIKKCLLHLTTEQLVFHVVPLYVTCFRRTLLLFATCCFIFFFRISEFVFKFLIPYNEKHLSHTSSPPFPKIILGCNVLIRVLFA